LLTFLFVKFATDVYNEGHVSNIVSFSLNRGQNVFLKIDDLPLNYNSSTAVTTFGANSFPGVVPVLSDIFPRNATVFGGSIINLYGTGLNIETVVKFTSISNDSFVAYSESLRQIEDGIEIVLSPSPNGQGPVTVEVSNDGISFAGSSIIFTYTNESLINNPSLKKEEELKLQLQQIVEAVS